MFPNVLRVWLIDSVTNYTYYFKKKLKNYTTTKKKLITNPSDKDRLFYPIRLQNRMKVKIYAKFFFTFYLHHERFFGAR